MKIKILFFTTFLFFHPNFLKTNDEEKPPFDWRIMTKDVRIASVARKVTLTPEVLAVLEAERANTAVFHLLSNQTLLLATTRLANYDNFFRQAVVKVLSPVDKGESGEWLVSWLKAIAFVESGGNPKAKSPAGAVGIMQLMSGTASRFGLTPSLRVNPEKNILAGARYFAYLYQMFGQKKCLATASYHMGEGNLRKIIKLGLKEFYGLDTIVNPENVASLVGAYNLSYPLLYFGAKPESELYNMVSGLKDNSMSYYWKVLAAERLLPLDSARFDSAYKQVVRSQEKPYRFFTWCLERDLAEDEVILLPFSTRKLYSFLDWRESPPEDDVMGEIRFRLSREGVGAAIAISVIYRDLLKSENVSFEPFALGEAETAPEYCRDFTFMIYQPVGTRQALLFHYIVKRLAALGFIAYKEDGFCYTIVATPEKGKKNVLEEIYLEAKQK